VSGRRADSGQAAVETALLLPLLVFLVLGTLQLFLVMQARVLAEYAVFRAARAGSLAYGGCTRMKHAALLTLLPSFDAFLGRAAPYGGTQSPADALGDAFFRYRTNHYRLMVSSGGAPRPYTGEVVWLDRTYEGLSGAGPEESDFDQPNNRQRLELTLTYFFPLRVPFANWVLSAMFLGHTAINPLSPTAQARWQPISSMQSSNPMVDEVRARAATGELVMPVVARYSMKMMTPVKAANRGAACR
jgi:hypothetical protein